MSLNIPDTRQSALSERLDSGQQIIALEVADEFGVSLDTVRRDLLALERSGKAQRVRGGAIPVAPPALPLHERMSDDQPVGKALIEAAVAEVTEAPTLLVDGGRTTLGVVEALPFKKDRLIITPSPWVAIACQRKAIDVFLLGGRLRPQGGITTGDRALQEANNIAADVALLGACGIDATFGLSSDDHDEAMMKQAMQAAANRTIVVTQNDKIGRRARHRTLTLAQISVLVTDAAPEQTAPLAQEGTRVVSV